MAEFNWHNIPQPRPRLWLRTRITRWQVNRNDPGRRTTQLMGIEGLLAAIVLNLGTANNNMFATRMGADAADLGRLASMPQLVAMLVLVPGTLLLGRIRSSRRPVERTALLAGFIYGLAALTPVLPERWRLTYFILIIALANAPVQLYNATWQNYFSDAVPLRERNDVYTNRTSLTFIAGIIVVQVTGILLGWAGDRPLRLYLYQAFYVLAFAAAVGQVRTLRQLPEASSPSSGRTIRDVWTSVRLMASGRRTLVFIVFAIIMHAGWYMGWQQFFVIQVHYMGANEAWLSVITVTGTLLQWLMIKPWGRYIRKNGVRKALVIGCAGLVASPLLTVAASYLPQAVQLPGMVLFNLVNAATYPAYQLSFFQATLEVLPRSSCNLNLSLFNALLLAVNTVSQLVGTGLYTVLGGDHRAITLAMLITTGVRVLGTFFFALYWWRLRDEPDVGIVYE